MEPITIHKVLSNETRRDILEWLKNPEEHFGEKYHRPPGGDVSKGVCVGDIQVKAGLAQSVISSYLLAMQKAGLLISERVGQWTYYRRNEGVIKQFCEELTNNL
ncbi:helix-turn-helix domain-containing protein [Paenibacillus urinalis]|uniref:Helix-turn-helix domain-containing protein n=1 Tax=Paenibacillus urinalis TaxID=521520 RepID=A0ABY7XH39_9BACL|nr:MULTISPECIES: helix-turn-helix domain-containing protein [Paenibacillus]WDH99247.1 helix-turn-helix domain-containing protein [Paenibacillus urinalis]WDI02940.1 helix-turn-helix domain-containing protein [Paenibacillus urinalis]GAK40442.1 hypothetical protein TCA2_2932 [Paenibacillus sp. TCA20]